MTNNEYPRFYLVHLIDKEGRRWYSPEIAESYEGIESVKLKCKESLEHSKEFIKAEISVMEEKLILTVE